MVNVTVVAVAVIAALLVWWRVSRRSPSTVMVSAPSVCADADALSMAALATARAAMGSSLSTSTAERGEIDQAGIDSHRRLIADFRSWAATTNPPCVHREYLSWADYFEYRAAKCEEELRTHKIRDSMVRYRKRREAEHARVREIEALLPKFPPKGSA